MIGIEGYGVYIPKYRIKINEISKTWGKGETMGMQEKAVPGMDEDSATLAVEAAKNALLRAKIDGSKIGAIYVGSESHPYAVKPTSTIVGEAICATPELMAADLQFACKAGTAGIQCCMGLVGAGMIDYGMAIGSDTSQSRPGDALEYTAGAGAAAYIIGKNDVLAEIESTYSFSTDTPDFWRREGQEFPKHGARFTGEPAYFKHVLGATRGLLEKTGHKLTDFDYVVFHQPNPKFPIEAAKILGIEPEKLKQGLLTPFIGNTYSGATPLGLASILDVAKPGQMILATSFGSGAGSDSFVIKVTDAIVEKQNLAKKTSEFINGEKVYLTYGEYVKHRRKLKSI